MPKSLDDVRRNLKGDFIQFTDWISRMYPNKEFRDNGIMSTKTVTFQVTEDCSLACKYCYQTNKSKKRMSWDVAKTMVDKLLSGEGGIIEYLNSPTAIIIEFIGGEPFLEIDLIDKITDYFRMRAIELNHPWAEKYMISICSNGVAYRDEKVQKYLQKNKKHLSISITIDGTKELHDSCRVFPDGSPSYDIAHAAAMDWMARGNDLGSKMTLAPTNITYFCDSLKQMIHDGYYDINANVVFEEGWELDHAKELWTQIKNFTEWINSSEYDPSEYKISYLDKAFCHPLPETDDRNWCGGTGEMLSIDPDGKLFPCIRYMSTSLNGLREPLAIGDVWTGIASKNHEKDIIKCLNCITRRSQSTDECFYCPIAAGCAWCSGYNYQVHGTANKRCTYICDTHKSRALSTVYYWNTYFYKNKKDEVLNLWVPKQWAVPIIGEEEYENLKKLTLELGGYVNESDTIIKNYTLDMYKDTMATKNNKIMG